MPYEPLNSSFAKENKSSFAEQAIMRLIGAELGRVEPGLIEIILAYRSDLTQQHGTMICVQ